MATQTAKSSAPSSTDRIETRTEVRAPRARVWRAIADSKEFGTWFGIALQGAFTPGATIRGAMTRAGCDDLILNFYIEQMQPEHYLSYRWHPYAFDPKVDYSVEPMTLVEFRLEEIATGTAIHITESGFDGIPLSRRAEAFGKHNEGWVSQTAKLVKYVA